MESWGIEWKKGSVYFEGFTSITAATAAAAARALTSNNP